MKFLTFQSMTVVRKILIGQTYHAEKELMRESSLSDEDIKHCNGQIPIWIFCHPYFATTQEVSKANWENLLNTFIDEMSLSREYGKSIDTLCAIELNLNYIPPKGIAHNGTSLARVIPSISLSQVDMIYVVSRMYREGESNVDFFLFKLTPIYNKCKHPLFPNGLQCTEEEYESNKQRSLKLFNFSNVEDYYNIEKVDSLIRDCNS